MATTLVLPALPIAGVHRRPTSQDLELSRIVYNSLPHPEEQPEISDHILHALGELFVRHGAHDNFGIHLLHGHFTAPEGTVLLGMKFQISDTSQACWTKPVPAAELATGSIHGHVFRLQADGFVPYEFQESQVGSKALKVEMAFFQDLADFLHRNKLADLIALQVLSGPLDNPSMEVLVGPQSTVMLDERDLVGFNPPRIITGWFFTVGEDGVISCKGNDVYAEKKNTHAVFQDTKPLPTVEALKEALRGEGIIV